MAEETVRLQYVSPHAGSVSFTVGDHAYRAGRIDPFLDVLSEHVNELLAKGVFTIVDLSKTAEPVVSPDSTPAENEKPTTPIAQTYGWESLAEPIRQALIDAGFVDAAAVQGADDTALLAVPGIGDVTLSKIRKALIE